MLVVLGQHPGREEPLEHRGPVQRRARDEVEDAEDDVGDAADEQDLLPSSVGG